MALRELPENDRPRERLLRQGPLALADAELLALVLGTGPPGRGALATAEAILGRFPDLRRLSVAGTAELAEIAGVGMAQACRIKAALALAGRLGERPFARGQRILGPTDVYERVGKRLVDLEREVFVALSLDSKNRILREHQVADGGVCSVEVIPRDVFTAVVREAAAAVVFVHNHPSGDPTPSRADEELTERMTEAGKYVGVQVVDHIIVAKHGYFSFAHRRAATRADP